MAVGGRHHRAAAVAELMFMDSSACASSAAQSGGEAPLHVRRKARVPLVVRTMIGAGLRAARSTRSRYTH